MGSMWNSHMLAVLIGLCLVFLSSHFVESKESDGKGEVSSSQSDFKSWVAKVGAKHAALVSSPEKPDQKSPALKRSKLDGAARVIVVDQGGAGDYRTVTDALNAVPLHNKQRVTIQVHAGTYVEKIIIPKSKFFITLQGAGRDVTSITYGESAVGTGTTYTSSTVGISAPFFTARNISFRNTAPSPAAGAYQQQAVAVRITGDCAAFYGCGFYGAQDTLYDDRGRHYFKECLIEGSIDFIFGNGLSMYKSCELRVIPTSGGSLTAQKRLLPTEDSGFSFVGCTVTGSGNVFLGRAWGPYSRVVFLYTWMANIIVPEGWFDWGIPARDSTTYYGEYQCFGPGATEYGRVRWAHQLTDAEAAPFLSLGFINGQDWVSEV